MDRENINLITAIILFVVTIAVAAVTQFLLQQLPGAYGVAIPPASLDETKLKLWYEIRTIMSLIPAAAAYLLMFAVWRFLPGKWWLKGVVFAVVLLTLKSQLFRLLIMGGAVAGNPPWRTAYIMIHQWSATLILGLGFAFTINYWITNREAIRNRPPGREAG